MCVLAAERMPPPPPVCAGEELAKLIIQVLREYNIVERVAMLTTDNSSNMVRAQHRGGNTWNAAHHPIQVRCHSDLLLVFLFCLCLSPDDGGGCLCPLLQYIPAGF
jgi:hypothetical protein